MGRIRSVRIKKINTSSKLLMPDYKAKYLVGMQKPYANIIPYYGGKYALLDELLPMIEMVARHNQATTYMEAFGGGGKCIINLGDIDYQFQRKIYNELDGGISRLFRVLQDRDSADRLIDMLADTEFTKEHFYECRNRKHTGEDPLEEAYDLLIVCYCSYGSNFYTYKKHVSNVYDSIMENISCAPEYLEGIEIRSENAFDLIEKYGRDPKVVLYLDPPYHPATRCEGAKKIYGVEMSAADHDRLVKLLCESHGWILSGYDPAEYGCDCYKPLEEAGAIKVKLDAVSTHGKSKITKNEVVWYRY